MTPIRFLILFAPLLLLAADKASKQNASRPNLIFILADDLGYGDVGFNGQQKIPTPAIDKLAAESLRFTQHYAGSTVCGPSRATLLTGMSQAVGFIKNNPGGKAERENLRKQDVTFAEKLKEAGYITAYFGKYGLGPKGMSGYPLNKGFDEFLGYDTHKSAHDYYPKSMCHNEGTLKLDGKTYSHNLFTQHALDFLAKDHKAPFCLFLGYAIPHSPYNPPSLRQFGDKNWKDLDKKYAAMIHLMDRDVGRILALAKKRGLEKNTIVIFSSDNGTSYPGVAKAGNPGNDFFHSSGPFRGRKRDFFDGGIRVPFTVKWPGTVTPGETNHVSGFQDFMPTVCEIVGASPPEGVDGISYLPTLLGRSGQKQHDYMYWEFVVGSSLKPGSGFHAMLDVKRNLKVIRQGVGAPLRIYDLNKDVTESKNVASQIPEIATELETIFNRQRGPSDLWPIQLFTYRAENEQKPTKDKARKKKNRKQ